MSQPFNGEQEAGPFALLSEQDGKTNWAHSTLTQSIPPRHTAASSKRHVVIRQRFERPNHEKKNIIAEMRNCFYQC
jgi:hypothetical protein